MRLLLNFETLKMTALVNTYSLFKIPLIAFVTPTVEELTDERTVVKIRLGLRTRNHLRVMYFGALAVGAELSIATKALKSIQASGKRIDFIFKDFQAEFLKRADGHVHFVCEEGKKVAQLVEKAAKQKDRVEAVFNGYAFVPSRSLDPVMKYRLTLSLKNRG